ncbi:MAG: major tail protein [Clostridium paraputrificum]
MKYSVKNGLRKCYVAKITSDGTWDVPKELGDLIEVSIQASENSATMYAGNRIIMTDSALGDIDGSITIPSLSEEMECYIFGHQKRQGGGIIKSSKDVKPYVAFLFEQTSKNDTTGEEVVDYVTLYKGQFNLAERKGKTKEGSPELQSTSLSMKFSTLNSGVYMDIVSTDSEGFDKVAFEKTWAKTITEPTVASVAE